MSRTTPAVSSPAPQLARTQIDSPWRKGDLTAPRKPKTNTPRHDRLCPDYIDADGKPVNLGLTCCWCLCSKCWDMRGSRCIHAGCPCRSYW